MGQKVNKENTRTGQDSIVSALFTGNDAKVTDKKTKKLTNNKSVRTGGRFQTADTLASLL